MRPLTLVLVMLVVAAGGGAAAWWFILRAPEEVAEAAPVPTGEPPEFVQFEPLVLPLIHQGQVTHHVTMTVVVETTAAGKEQVLLAKRQLTDAYLSELYGLLARRFVRRQANALPLLRRRLLVVSDRLLGPGVVTDVLLAEPSRRRPVSP